MATLAPALETLRDEIDKRWPRRSKVSDGWIGDSSHAARKSDHNPDARGRVNAIDITVANTAQGKEIRDAVLKATIGDGRVWYVIHDGYIYSKTYNWARRKYTGTNPHKKHIHVSCNYNNTDAEESRKPWGILHKVEVKTKTTTETEAIVSDKVEKEISSIRIKREEK